MDVEQLADPACPVGPQLRVHVVAQVIGPPDQAEPEAEGQAELVLMVSACSAIDAPCSSALGWTQTSMRDTLAGANVCSAMIAARACIEAWNYPMVGKIFAVLQI